MAKGRNASAPEAPLAGLKVAILVEDGYETLEFWYPYYRLKEAGATVVVAAHERRAYNSKNDVPAEPDLEGRDLDSNNFDAVVLPGGVKCPDIMRTRSELVSFVRQMHDEGKLVASICHAAWVPISAGIVKGRTLTCYHSVKDDVINAGGKYVDEEVVVDRNLITSRFPDDLPAFCQAIIQYLEGKGRGIGVPLRGEEPLRRPAAATGRSRGRR